MEIKVADLRALMDALHDKTGEPRNTKGWENIEELVRIKKLGKLGERYIYKSIVNKTEKRKAGDSIDLRAEHIDALAKLLDHKSFNDFAETLSSGRDPQLDSCLGSYYSYIRANARETALLRSPARIRYNKGKYIFEQKGKITNFSGEIKSKKGCVFVLLDSKEGKSFYHVYKLGEIKSPQVLQGIFSGVSSSFDPIGGRVVLIKTPTEFKDLVPMEIRKSELAVKEAPVKTLFEYFESSERNNLTINRSTTFSLKDLTE